MSIPILNPIILVLLGLFALNWYRLQKGGAADKLYDKLDIESVFIKQYEASYSVVSDYISKDDFLERAGLFHREFRYDVVKFINRDLPSDKVKALKKEAKKVAIIPFNLLPEALQMNANEVASKLVDTLLERCKPKVEDPQKPKRRRRR